MDDKRQRLLEILRDKSLKIGHFKLVSGMTSNYYFDSKFTTLDPEGAYLTAWTILDEIRRRGVKAEGIGGLTLGADPIVAAVAAVSHAAKEFSPLAGFIVRKEGKKHGTQRFIEGFDRPAGTPVVIIDDVCTTGGSTLKAVTRAEEAGYRVVLVLCLVDREQGGAEALSDYPFCPIFTAEQLLDDPLIQDQLSRLADTQSGPPLSP